MTSPPGGGMSAWPKRASSGPASRNDARMRSACSRSIVRLGVDVRRRRGRPRCRRATRRVTPMPSSTREHRLDVADPRHVAHDDLLGREDARRRGSAGRRSCCRRARPCRDSGTPPSMTNFSIRPGPREPGFGGSARVTAMSVEAFARRGLVPPDASGSSPSPLRRHCLAVEAAMRAYARAPRRGRGAVGRRRAAARHGLRALSRPRRPATRAWRSPSSRARTSTRSIVRAIASHADFLGVSRDSPMEKTLYAVDELSGFLLACAYVRPEGIHGLTPKSVKKKLKQPSFAAAVNRDEVRAGRRGARRRLRRARAVRHRGARGARRRARRARLPAAGAERARACATRASSARRTSRAAAGRRARRAPADRDRRRSRSCCSCASATGSYAPPASCRRRSRSAAARRAPLSGRLDRPPRAARACSCRSRSCTPARLAALVGLGARSARRSALLVLGGAASPGVAIPPISAALRPLWRRAARTTTRTCSPTAYALDSVIVEFVFVVGPLLTARRDGAAVARRARWCSRRSLLVGGTLAFAVVRRRRARGGRTAPRGGHGVARRAALARACGRSSPRRCRSASASARWRSTLPAFGEDMAQRARGRACCSPSGRSAAPPAGSSTARGRARCRSRATYVRARGDPAADVPAARARAVVLRRWCRWRSLAGVAIAPLLATRQPAGRRRRAARAR